MLRKIKQKGKIKGAKSENEGKLGKKGGKIGEKGEKIGEVRENEKNREGGIRENGERKGK